MPPNYYYVYAFVDTSKEVNSTYGGVLFKHEPFYIGKGKGRRAWTHKGNAHTKNKIDKLKSLGVKVGVDVLLGNLTEEESLLVESALILAIGRVDLGTGELTNWHASGADQCIKNKTHHALTCSLSQKKRFEDPQEIQKTRDATYRWLSDNPEIHAAAVKKRNATLRTPEKRKQISASIKKMHAERPEITARQRSSREATRVKTDCNVRASRALGGTPIGVYKDGVLFQVFETQRLCARILGASLGNINMCLNGKRNHTHGYTFVRQVE